MCNEAANDYTRCVNCPLDLLDQAESSEAGQLLMRAIRINVAMKMGVTVTLSDIASDEFQALQILEDEREKYEAEKK